MGHFFLALALLTFFVFSPQAIEYDRVNQTDPAYYYGVWAFLLDYCRWHTVFFGVVIISAVVEFFVRRAKKSEFLIKCDAFKWLIILHGILFWTGLLVSLLPVALCGFMLVDKLS